jgi:ribosome-associated heat shock protein Hsp15
MGRSHRSPVEAQTGSNEAADRARIRLDKWLWAARFFKTRALAMEAIDRGRILVGSHAAKPSREVHLGDEIEIRQPGGLSRTVLVQGLSDARGPAVVAQQLYSETDSSRTAREAALILRRMGVEPALAQANGRPTKRDRRELAQWDRWSASLDDTHRS